MHDNDPKNSTQDPLELPSKSELKRRMTALQVLGERLVELREGELAKMPIDDERLHKAVLEARSIRTNSARKRHLQFIGKLMRDLDPAPLEKALDKLHQQQRKDTGEFHELEAERDRLLAEGLPGIEAVVARWPHADRQQLRQWVLQYQREVKANKPPAASRKLFKYLRELRARDAAS